MKEWIIGDNASGKTVLLEQRLSDYLSRGLSVVTNLGSEEYSGFDEERLSIISSDEIAENVLDYAWVTARDNHLVFEGDTAYSDAFFKCTDFTL